MLPEHQNLPYTKKPHAQKRNDEVSLKQIIYLIRTCYNTNHFVDFFPLAQINMFPTSSGEHTLFEKPGDSNHLNLGKEETQTFL